MLCLTFEQIARMEGQISSSLKFDKRACRKSSLAFHWKREWKKFASDEAALFCPMSNLIQKHPQAQLIASFSTFSCSCFCCRTLPLSHCKEAFCAFLPKRLERRGPTMVLSGQFLFWTFGQRCWLWLPRLIGFKDNFSRFKSVQLDSWCLLL